jgi:transcriptional regulator with XRE-family HTH domain
MKMIEIGANEKRGTEWNVLTKHQSSRATFGPQLCAIRRQLGLTQADVERLTRRLSKRQRCPDFTLTKCRLSRIENGWSNPGPAKILGLAKVYHLSVKEMVRLWAGQPSDAQEGKERVNAVQ